MPIAGQGHRVGGKSWPRGAANRCLDEARGDYLVRLDADDLAVPDRLSKQVAYMDAHPEVVASGGHLQLFGARDRLWKFPIDHDDCMANLLFGVPVSQGASIMRRSLVEQHHLRYDPSWPRVGRTGCSGCAFRVSDDSATWMKR
ncbi:MAG: glycosyltransferase [Flavobacteriales bacterium]|nr:glycosyltransferase [Flavobacteriales bacterium]